LYILNILALFGCNNFKLMQKPTTFYFRNLTRFGKVSQDVLRDHDVSMNAKAVYALLCSYLGEKAYCYPSVSDMTYDLKASKSKIDRALNELREKGIIKRIHTPPGLASNTYVTDEGYQQQWKKELCITSDIPTTPQLT
jgi:DNA-binding MarR family transcriptional regulator